MSPVGQAGAWTEASDQREHLLEDRIASLHSMSIEAFEPASLPLGQLRVAYSRIYHLPIFLQTICVPPSSIYQPQAWDVLEQAHSSP